MEIYEYRRQIQKIYNESVYGNIKGDIYNELSDLRIDNSFIESIKCNQQMKTITFKLSEDITEKDISNLYSQIRTVIKDFITKNISEEDEELKKFLETDLCYDSYKLNNNIIVQI